MSGKGKAVGAADDAANKSRTAALRPHRFPPGVSGNPNGRPKSHREVQRLAESLSAEAIERLAEIMRGRNTGEARQAAIAILDRAYGKPAQALDVGLHRSPDVGAIGGNPDQARARLEALISEAEELATDGSTVALTLEAPPLRAILDAEVVGSSEVRPTDPETGGGDEEGGQP